MNELGLRKFVSIPPGPLPQTGQVPSSCLEPSETALVLVSAPMLSVCPLDEVGPVFTWYSAWVLLGAATLPQD